MQPDAEIHGVHCAGLSDFSVRGAMRRHFLFLGGEEGANGATLSQEVPTLK
jgi:hypothetical protein